LAEWLTVAVCLVISQLQCVEIKIEIKLLQKHCNHWVVHRIYGLDDVSNCAVQFLC